MGFPGGVVVKNLPANAGDVREPGSIPGSGRSPAGEHGYPLQYSCLEKPMDREAWWVTVQGALKDSDRAELTEDSYEQQAGTPAPCTFCNKGALREMRKLSKLYLGIPNLSLHFHTLSTLNSEN